MIVLDYRDQRPLYEQIAERFQELIEKGILPQDMQMPSVRGQAMQLSINPNTIQRAYSELERRGYIYSVKGKGSFVADITSLMDVRRAGWEEQLEHLAEEGYSIGVERVRMEEIIRRAEVHAAKAEDPARRTAARAATTEGPVGRTAAHAATAEGPAGRTAAHAATAGGSAGGTAAHAATAGGSAAETGGSGERTEGQGGTRS